MKKILLFFIAFITILSSLTGQNRSAFPLKTVQNRDVQHERDGRPWLNFKADKTEGDLPLSVQFSITTSVDAVSYQWSFGDGQTSSEESPVHTYYNEGFYSVSIQVVDVNDTIWTGYQHKYIKAGDPIKYDTLNYPIPGNFALYELNPPQSGYVAGNNSFYDQAKAEYFKKPAGYFTINNIWFDFAVAKNDTTNADTAAQFIMYDVHEETGAPWRVKKSFFVDIDTIARDVLLDQATPLPVEDIHFKDDFFMAVVLPQSSGDTLALWSNTDGDVDPGNAWEQWQDGSWHPMNAEDSWQLNINLGIYVSQYHGPVAVEEAGDIPDFSVYPNPAKDYLNIKWMQQPEHKMEISLYSLLGREILRQEAIAGSRELVRIDLSPYPEGMYLLHVSDGTSRMARKVSITR